MGILPISKHELLAVDDDVEFVGGVIDQIWMLPWPKDYGSAEYVEYFQSLPKELRVIWSTWEVQRLVKNGGFGGYFANLIANCYVDEARDGFRSLGVDEMLVMFESVLDYFNAHAQAIHAAKDWEEFSKIMGFGAIENHLPGITFNFVAGFGDFYAVRRRYITSNIDTFCDRP